MNKLLLIALLALTGTANATYCTNGAKDYPKCTPPASSLSSNSNSAATSNSMAGAVAGAVATAGSTALGGAGGAGGAGGVATVAAGAAMGGNVSTSGGDSNLWVMPAPVFTPPMITISCPQAAVNQEAFAVGWNFLSYAKSNIDPMECTLIQIRNAKVETCQYASAKQIEDMMVKRRLPDYVPNPVVMDDYTPAECKLLLAPPKSVPPVLYIPPVQAPVCPAPVVKPKAKAAAPKKVC